MKVLVADDSRVILTLAEKYILSEGHEVITAADGEEAVDRFEQDRPDLVLLDVKMPGRNGYETARLIKDISTERDHWIPIIFLSAMGGDEDIRRGLESGGDDYLTKPFSRVILSAKLKAMQRIADMRQQLKVVNDELKDQTGIDGLTGILSRRRFDEILLLEVRRAARNNKPISLILCDIDHFKAYNDNYGHQTGDDCLRRVAHTLHRSLKRAGDVVARYGGEAFAVIAPDTTEPGAIFVAVQMLEAVQALEIEHAFSDVSGNLTVSLGVASRVPKPYEPAEKELAAMADECLYAAKREGRNRICRLSDLANERQGRFKASLVKAH